MNYEFPEIKHINEVLPAIDGSAEFIVVDKGDYKVINYVVMNEDTFPPINGMYTINGPVVPVVNILRRECRGLIFDKNGVLINRRFHKFFNVNERPETALEKIDWSKPHYILEKLDGSMVSPCKIDGHIRWMTKMGITDTSMEAEYFVATHPNYTDFVSFYLEKNCTPIFEWCSRKNRIVLDYAEDQLVLLAIRDNFTGKYHNIGHYDYEAHNYDIPIVKSFGFGDKNIVDVVRQQEDTEGVVVRFEDGHMVKIKSDWYVRIHKVKSALENEREVVAMALNNELDDMYPVLPEADVERIKKFSSLVIERIEEIASDLYEDITRYQYRGISRKDFALNMADEYDPLYRGLIFRYWDEKNIDRPLLLKAVCDTIMKNCGSNQAYRKIKEEFLKDIDYA